MDSPKEEKINYEDISDENIINYENLIKVINIHKIYFINYLSN